MQNYFNYFTEIEERFQQRRGSLLMLSTLDWALIETWREAGIPLEAVLRGVDNAFDKHDAKTLRASGRTRKVNGLAWCAQSVMEAVEQAMEASIGAAPGATPAAGTEAIASGFETERVGRYLEQNASVIDEATLSPPADAMAAEVAGRLRALAVLTSAPEAELVALREQAARELAPYRGKMQAVQIKQVQQQFLQKKMLEARKLPRLSLFYMSHG
jgi:hypothetical protein